MEMEQETLKTPKDRLNLAFFIFVLHGIGFLLPYNVFSNAEEYYINYKFNTTLSENTDYRINFLNYVLFAGQIPNVLMAAWNAFYQQKSGMSDPTPRLIASMITELVILIITTVMVFVDTSKIPFAFFILTLMSIILLNCCVGIHQTITFGLAACFPMEYSNANICGVFIATINLLVRGLSEIWGVTQRSIIISRACYFTTASIYVVVCIIAYIVMRRLEFVRYYLDPHLKKSRIATNEDEVEIESVDTKRKSVVTLILLEDFISKEDARRNAGLNTGGDDEISF
ncbi:hypothetical protein ACTXT7_004367 [Hymenolepis weldensis]